MSKIVRTFPPHDRQRYGDWYCCPVDVKENGEIYLKKVGPLVKSKRNPHTGETTLIHTLTYLPFIAYGRLDKLTGKHEVEYFKVIDEKIVGVEYEYVEGTMKYVNIAANEATENVKDCTDLTMRIVMKRRGYSCRKIGGEDS